MAMRAGALATAELDLVGMELNLPANPMQLPQNAPFYVPVSFEMGGKAATAAQLAKLYPSDAYLVGVLSGPGLSAPVSLTGTIANGLSAPCLPQAGDFTVSGVQLVSGNRVLLTAKQPTFTVKCLGEILLTSVSSSPMTLQEIKDAGIQLQPGDYVGRRFEMVLSVGSRQISLNVPVAIPVYNGLENPVGGSGDFGDLQIGNLIGGDLPPGLSVVMANLSPEKDPFSLSRPGVSFQMKHGFKAMLWSLDIFRTPA